jgi:4-amino-4-deoxy-L-arabinose transferase-like glycosyltransferase
VGFAWAWLATSSALVMGINWDTASYIAHYASHQGAPTDLPWNSHYGLGPVYGFGALLARAFGGTYIDGVRLLGALALGATAFVLARFGQARAGRAGVLWALLYVVSWGVAQLVLTLEDNVLYLPVAAFSLVYAITNADNWSWRNSVIAGSVVGTGVLISWQAGLYLFPALYVAMFCGVAQSRLQRLKQVAFVFAAFTATLLIFVAVFHSFAPRHSWMQLLQVLFSRPEPSFFPKTFAEVGALFVNRRSVFAQLAIGLRGEVLLNAAGSSEWLPSVGISVLVLAAVAAAWSWWRARTTGKWRGAVAWVSLVAILVATALYVDLPADRYKRYDFVPLFFCVGAAFVTSWMKGARLRIGMSVVAGALVLASLWLSVSEARAYRRRLPQTQPANYQGRGHEPWFVYFRRLRTDHPQACLFTLPLDASLLHGRYQLEIPAALWAELPDHQLVGDPELIKDWPVKVKVVLPTDLKPAKSCEWRADFTGQ